MAFGHMHRRNLCIVRSHFLTVELNSSAADRSCCLLLLSSLTSFCSKSGYPERPIGVHDGRSMHVHTGCVATPTYLTAGDRNYTMLKLQ